MLTSTIINNMEPKYKLTEETIEFRGRTLYRIQALRKFAYISIGQLGGWVEKKSNLSHDGDCWIYDNAKAYDRAMVLQNAMLKDNAIAYGTCVVYGQAYVTDNSEIYGGANVFENARVFKKSHVFGNAHVYENSYISDDARVYGNADVFGDSSVCGNAEVFGDAEVSGNSLIFSGQIQNSDDYICLGPVGDIARFITYNKPERKVKVGCFYGTLAELETSVKEKYCDRENKGYSEAINYFRLFEK